MQGGTQLLSELGYVGPDLEDVCERLADICSHGDGAFSRECARLAATMPLQIREHQLSQQLKRPRECISTAVPAASGKGWPTRHKADLARAEGPEQRRALEVRE